MRLELAQRVFGNSAAHLDLRSGSSLSWSEHKALMASAAGSMATAHTLAQLRYDVQDVTMAVESLTREIGLQLQDQTLLLIRQVELLAEIAETLRTPARTRAAERISNAGELLSRERYERALTLAMQAIDDDPNNPAGFLAAAWASLGLDNVEQARDFFREAKQASDGDQRQSALRQAARLTFLLEGPQNALKELGGSPEQLSPTEEAATEFDRAVYFSHAGDSATAAKCIRKVSELDGRFCLMALTDPILSRDAAVSETAAEQLRAIQELADTITAEVSRAHARYQALCKEIEDLGLAETVWQEKERRALGLLGLAEAVWQWRERRDEEWQDVLESLPHLPYCGLNTFPELQAAASEEHAVCDHDEQALVERRAEMVLNDALAREVNAGWMVVRRGKLCAAIHKIPTRWEWGAAKVRKVGLDPSGKVISTKARSEWNRELERWEFHTPVGVVEAFEAGTADRSYYRPCKYCLADESNDHCQKGELELFP